MSCNLFFISARSILKIFANDRLGIWENVACEWVMNGNFGNLFCYDHNQMMRRYKIVK